jgi:hypothetical protein
VNGSKVMVWFKKFVIICMKVNNHAKKLFNTRKKSFETPKTKIRCNRKAKVSRNIIKKSHH